MNYQDKKLVPFWIRAARPLAQIALVFSVIGVLLFACQSKLVYYPTKKLEGTPSDVGLKYETVSLSTSDGVKLHGWFVPAENQRAVLLLCHGNGGNVSHRVDIIKLFNRLGLSTFAFDYRGYGKSDGSPDEEGTYLDAEAAWRYLTEIRAIDSNMIVIHGRSLGGAIASHLALSHIPGALIVDSSFTSLNDIGQEVYPFLPVRLLSRFDYSTLQNVASARCPVLVIHSSNDEVVPYHHGKQIFEAAPEPKQFIEIQGGHNDNYIVSSRVYGNGLKAFIDKHLSD